MLVLPMAYLQVYADVPGFIILACLRQRVAVLGLKFRSHSVTQKRINVRCGWKHYTLSLEQTWIS